MTTPLLELREISKRFGATQALFEASISLLPGEIHALLGENGAGKTTLVSIAAGRLAPDAGTIRRGGTPVTFADPRAARRAGIALVPQHDLLVEAASVADNLALLDPATRFFESGGARRRRVEDFAGRFALDLGDADARVGDLPVGARQRIEIAGALAGEPDILILDEPTAVLSPDETASLFLSLRKRADSGKAVVLITHRLAEVFQTADRLTLLARGRTVKTCRAADTTKEEIGSLLLGNAEGTRESTTADFLEGEYRGNESTGGSLLISVGCKATDDSRKRAPRPSAVKGALRAPRSGLRPLTAEGRGLSVSSIPVLELELVAPSPSLASPVSLSLSEAEILVLLAIDGNGADLIAACVAGMHPFSGRIEVQGRAMSPAGDPRAFRACGGRYVPADRRAEGLISTLTLAENLALPSPPGRFFLDRAALLSSATSRIARFGVRASSPASYAAELSGGNQQKLVLARELDDSSGAPRLLVAIHPTRGLDIAASADVHDRIEEARRRGCAVLVVSSDPDEARLFGGTFRVVYRGVLSEPLSPSTPFDVLGRRMAGLAA